MPYLTDQKRCQGECHKYLAKGLFAPDPTRRDGLDYICKACRQATEDRRASRKETKRQCLGKCGRWLKRSEFGGRPHDPSRPDRLCKDCRKAVGRFGRKIGGNKRGSGRGATKQCLGDCKQRLPRESFGPLHRSYDGLDTHCTECRAAVEARKEARLEITERNPRYSDFRAGVEARTAKIREEKEKWGELRIGEVRHPYEIPIVHTLGLRRAK